MAAIAMVGAVLILLIGLIFWEIRNDNRARKTPYQTVAEGFFDSAEYATEGGKYGGEVTVVHFNDGRTCVARGFHNIQATRGEKIKVLKNEWNYKIEEASEKTA